MGAEFTLGVSNVSLEPLEFVVAALVVLYTLLEP